MSEVDPSPPRPADTQQHLAPYYYYHHYHHQDYRFSQGGGFTPPANYNAAAVYYSRMRPLPHQSLAPAPPVPAHEPLSGTLRNVSTRPGLTSHNSNNTGRPSHSQRARIPRPTPRRTSSLASSSGSKRSHGSGNSNTSKSRRSSLGYRGQKSPLLRSSSQPHRSSAFNREAEHVGLLPKLGNLLLGTNPELNGRQPGRDKHRRDRRSAASPRPSKRRPPSATSASNTGSRRRRESLIAPSEMSLTSAATGRTSSSSGSNSTVTQGSYSRLRRAKPSISLEPYQEDEIETHSQEPRERRESTGTVNVFDFLDQDSSPPETEPYEEEDEEDDEEDDDEQQQEDWSSASSEDSEEEEEDDDNLDQDATSETTSTVPTSLSSSPADSFKARERVIAAPRPISYAGDPRRPSLGSQGSQGSPRSHSAQLRANLHQQMPRPYSLHAGDPETALELFRHQNSSSRPHIPGHFPSLSGLRERPRHISSTDDVGSGSSTYLSSRSSSARRGGQEIDLLARKMSSATIESSQDTLVPVYRGFEFLHHRVLQHLQNELITLEDELSTLDRDCDEANMKPNADIEYHKTELLGRVYMKMDQYHNALNGYKTFTKDLDTASSSDVAAHRQWVESHADMIAPRTSRYLDREDDLIKVCRSSRLSSRDESAIASDQPSSQNVTSTLVLASIAFAIFMSFLSVFGSLSFGTAMSLLLYHCGVMSVAACMGVGGLRDAASTWLDASQLKTKLRAYLVGAEIEPSRRRLKHT